MKKFQCKICNYQTNIKCNYQKHCTSKRHHKNKEMAQNSSPLAQNSSPLAQNSSSIKKPKNAINKFSPSSDFFEF